MVKSQTAKKTTAPSEGSSITANGFNDHYAAISSDASYVPLCIKVTANNWNQSDHITENRIFDVLDTLRQTSMGLEKIPAWFVKIGAPFLVAPLAYMSLTSSVVPRQWKAAFILPIPKTSIPLQHSDYRPISITPVLFRVLERIAVRDFIYPSFQTPPPGLNFHDQFTFQPSGSTAVTLIQY